MVLSVLTEYSTGELTVPAFGTSYILAKTEVDGGEDVRYMNGNPISAGIYVHKIVFSRWESTGKITILN